MPALGQMKVISIHYGMGTGNDHGLRFQLCDLFRNPEIGIPGAFNLPFTAAPHFGHNQWRMRYHICSH